MGLKRKHVEVQQSSDDSEDSAGESQNGRHPKTSSELPIKHSSSVLSILTINNILVEFDKIKVPSGKVTFDRKACLLALLDFCDLVEPSNWNLLLLENEEKEHREKGFDSFFKCYMEQLPSGTSMITGGKVATAKRQVKDYFHQRSRGLAKTSFSNIISAFIVKLYATVVSGKISAGRRLKVLGKEIVMGYKDHVNWSKQPTWVKKLALAQSILELKNFPHALDEATESRELLKINDPTDTEDNDCDEETTRPTIKLRRTGSIHGTVTFADIDDQITAKIDELEELSRDEERLTTELAAIQEKKTKKVTEVTSLKNQKRIDVENNRVAENMRIIYPDESEFVHLSQTALLSIQYATSIWDRSITFAAHMGNLLNATIPEPENFVTVVQEEVIVETTPAIPTGAETPQNAQVSPEVPAIPPVVNQPKRGKGQKTQITVTEIKGNSATPKLTAEQGGSNTKFMDAYQAAKLKRKAETPRFSVSSEEDSDGDKEEVAEEEAEGENEAKGEEAAEGENETDDEDDAESDGEEEEA